MRESPFGFEYSWEDLRPVRPLFVTVLVAQFLGAVVGLAVGYFPGWFENIWIGGAIATFPGFLVGLPIQMRARAEAINENRVMVRRIGLVALILTVVGITMPWWWHAG
jgi:ABC-type dipeptide/oligopeptide/nickel transport system permease subunit